ncbi:hypothetical protein [Daejeonella sp.]
MRIEDLKTRKSKAERLQDTTRLVAIIAAFISVFVFFIKIVFL